MPRRKVGTDGAARVFARRRVLIGCCKCPAIESWLMKIGAECAVGPRHRVTFAASLATAKPTRALRPSRSRQSDRRRYLASARCPSILALRRLLTRPDTLFESACEQHHVRHSHAVPRPQTCSLDRIGARFVSFDGCNLKCDTTCRRVSGRDIARAYLSLNRWITNRESKQNRDKCQCPHRVTSA
jgi:hypothetical protein